MITHVYQLRSDTELLYVGHARRLKQRLGQHRVQKPWWPEVTEVLSEEFATKDEAILREKEIWASGRPKYNRVSPFRTDEEWAEHNHEYERQLRQTGEYQRRQREYRQKPETKAYMREYRQKPENRARARARQRTPEYLAQIREYKQRPEIKAREQIRDRGRLRGRRRWQQSGPGLFD